MFQKPPRGACQAAVEPFDPQLAFSRLALKQSQFAEAVTHFLSEIRSQAGAEGTLRSSSRAEELADAMIRIVGGQPVPAGERPDCCLVGRQSENGTFRWYCSGVLVHPRIAITAGHCFDIHLPMNIVALNCADKDSLQDAEIRNIKKVSVHPDYLYTATHDLTVLVLRDAAVTAPAQITSTAEIAAANKVRLVGFGNNDRYSLRGFGLKRAVSVEMGFIRRSPNDQLDEPEHRLGFESDFEFIAGGEGYDSCNGDSGGPAYVDAGGISKVAGVTSRAIRGSSTPCGDGGIYTRLDQHLQFIGAVAADQGIAFG